MSFGNCLFDDRFVTAFRCRYVGIYKGIPYEGRMTKADGNRKKWWEGNVSVQLYEFPLEQRTLGSEQKILLSDKID